MTPARRTTVSFAEAAVVSLVCFGVAATVAGCDSAESARIEETRARLVGTWLDQVDADSTRSRRVLSLAADGKFTDHVLIPAPGGASERRELAGEWSYDGTNLKRRYLQENGRKFAGGSMRYATFPVRSVTPSEFVLDDNIQHREARYRRVPNGTRP